MNKENNETYYDVFEYKNNEWCLVDTCQIQYQAVRSAEEIWAYETPSKIERVDVTRTVIDVYGDINE